VQSNGCAEDNRQRPLGTDHCPGYGSAAKYIATSIMEVYHDARVYDTGMITILEIMEETQAGLPLPQLWLHTRAMVLI